MRIVDHVLVWLFGNDVISSPKHLGFSCINTRVDGREVYYSGENPVSCCIEAFVQY